MTRFILILLVGFAVGTGTYQACLRNHHANEGRTLEGHLGWMRQELGLSDAQFDRIRILHRNSHPKLQEMAAQVARMETEFAAFERTRRTTDRVDFVEFARFVESRRTLNQACLDSTKRLILASAEVMTAPQRERYLSFVAKEDRHLEALAN